MSSLETTIELSTGKLSAKVWGPKEGKKVLALHGWLDNAASFDHLAPLLGEYRLIALDLPGHGHSSHRPDGTTYHHVDAVATITQVLNQLGWPQVNLLAHSMGAGIASLVAGTFPDRIEKMVLLEGLGPLSYTPDEAPSRLARSILQHAELSTKKLPVYESTARATAVRCKVSGFSEKAAKPLIDRGLKPVEGGFTWRSDPRLTTESPLRMTEEQVLAFLQRISCPVLLVKASQGLPYDIAKMEIRQKAVRHLQLIEVAGHHHFHLEDPEPIAKAITAFF